MPLGTEVDLGPGHIVLDGVPAPRERGIAAPLFSAHVYYGHGRPSQLLLSSCQYFIACYLLHSFIAFIGVYYSIFMPISLMLLRTG